jgi:hypothetical protein
MNVGVAEAKSFATRTGLFGDARVMKSWNAESRRGTENLESGIGKYAAF